MAEPVGLEAGPGQGTERGCRRTAGHHAAGVERPEPDRGGGDQLGQPERNQNREIMAQADAERMEAFAELREPSVLTAWNLARIRILSPAVGVKARALVEASDRVVTVERSLELQAARDSALADFLAAVSAELGVKPAAAAAG